MNCVKVHASTDKVEMKADHRLFALATRAALLRPLSRVPLATILSFLRDDPSFAAFFALSSDGVVPRSAANVAFFLEVGFAPVEGALSADLSAGDAAAGTEACFSFDAAVGAPLAFFGA